MIIVSVKQKNKRIGLAGFEGAGIKCLADARKCWELCQQIQGQDYDFFVDWADIENQKNYVRSNEFFIKAV